MKKTFALLLAAVMMFVMLPVMAFAATPVASVGGVDYATLQEAVDAAMPGDTVTVLASHTLPATLTVAAGQTIILDLNGCTVDMTYAESVKVNGSHTMLRNSGNLTIQDSSGTNAGTLSYCYTGEADPSYSTSANTVTTLPGSVLTINSGTIENTTAQSGYVVTYAVDGLTNATLGDVTVNITGGVITSNHQSVRIFANSDSNTGTLKITGGEFYGRVIVQSSNTKANKAVLDISGGTFEANPYKTEILYVGGSGNSEAIEASITGGDFTGEVITSYSPAKRFITGGTYSLDVNDLVDDGYFAAVPADGAANFEVLPREQVQALVGDPEGDAAFYESLEDAFEAMEDGDVVEINPFLPDGTIVEIPEGKQATVYTSEDGTSVLEEGKYTAHPIVGESGYAYAEYEPYVEPTQPTEPTRPNPSTGVRSLLDNLAR